MRVRIAALLAGVSLSAVAAHAQDATWQGPGNDWDTGSNWSAGRPSNTATFIGNGAPNTLTFSFPSTNINQIQFNPGAPTYTFNVGFDKALSVNGNGVINNSLNTQLINIAAGGRVFFNNSSTADTLTISVQRGATFIGTLNFNDTSNAGNATIFNGQTSPSIVKGGDTFFNNSSTAGNATIVNTQGGSLAFGDQSSAGNAVITNGDSTGLGQTSFFGMSTAGNARITNTANGTTDFLGMSTAGNASITNAGGLFFGDSSTAGSSTITNNNILNFENNSTAGNATITTNNIGLTSFFDTATGGNARFVTNAGGVFDMSVLTSGGMTAGSIEGAGSIFLGSKNLAVGGSNLSMTFSGIISDCGPTGMDCAFFKNFGISPTGGSLTKVGTGTLTLSGANTYAGGTVIAAGTLQLSGAGTLGATTGTTTINTSGTLDLGGTTQTQATVNLAGGTLQNGSLNGPISSTGGIIHGIGGNASLTTTAGMTIVEGVNNYTGATTINGGILNVIGTISDPTVNSSGVLMGTGTVGSTQVNAGGTFAPGSGTPGTSMTVAGNLAFQSGAIYLVQVTPAAASATTVTGSASLTGGTVNAQFASGSYLSKQYTILTAAGGLGGTRFSTLTNTNLPAGFTDTLSYNSNDVFLNLTATLGASAGRSALACAFGINQCNVATAINNFFNSGGTLPPAFAALFNLTDGALGNALTQLDGEAATGAERAVFQLTNEFLTLMLDPFVNGRGNGGGVGGPALGFAPDQQTSLPPDIALAYRSILTKAPPPPTFEQRWTAWGSAYGGSNIANGNAVVGSNNITASTFGFAGGMDYHLSPSTVVGFALAGAGTNWGLADALGTGRSDALQVGGYGISWFGPAYLAGALAFSNHWFTTNRFSAENDELAAKFVGQSYGARLEGGYRYAVFPGFGVTPYGAVQFQDFHTPSYSESDLTGGGFGLTYNAMNATDVRTELGARFQDFTVLYNKPLILFGRLAWAHDFVSNPALNAVFEALPGASFTVFGAPIPHDSALTTLGAQLFLTPNWSLLAKFEGEFANGSQTYAGTGTLRYTW
jgi:autotransporter-associated beta strand protein